MKDWFSLLMLVLVTVMICVFVMRPFENQRKLAQLEKELKEAHLLIDTLSVQLASKPPVVYEESLVYIQVPVTVKPDTISQVDTIFIGDTAITNKYPKAIWQVSYNGGDGRLIFSCYDGERRTRENIGSFYIEGDSELTFNTSPFIEHTVTERQPFARLGWSASVGASYFNSMRYEATVAGGLVFLGVVRTEIGGGVAYSNSTQQIEPKLFAEVRLTK